MLLRTLFAAALLAGSPLPALAHEFWVEPEQYQVQSGAPLMAHLRNGQEFKGSSLAYFKTQTVRFELIAGAATTAIAARMGDIPALNAVAPGDGLLVVLHETAESTLKYTEWDKFVNFARHKDFATVVDNHLADGLPQDGFTETYRRFCKALVAVGTGQGADAPSGMETEFVALSNPYTDDPASGLTVQLLYQGEPRANVQVEVFDKAPDKTVSITYLRTDAEGRTVVPLTPGHQYLLDGVVMRRVNKGAPFDENLPVWESLWAAMTFAVPG